MTILKGVKDRIDVKVTANIDTDNGRTIKVPFVVTAKKPSFDERKDVAQKIDRGELLDEDLVAEYLLGWHGLKDQNDSEIDFNAETLGDLMAATEYRAALVRGLLTAILGKEAMAKNS